MKKQIQKDKSEIEAYNQGRVCGASPTGGFAENPYGYRERKKRAAWLFGWMKGGETFLRGRDA